MLLHEAQQYLDSFVNFEAKLSLATPDRFNLARVELLLEKLGNPHRKLKCLHIAGTNGKGSVCALGASILQHLGYKTGLYTSPHLWDFKERIRILDPSMRFQKDQGFGGQIPEEDLCAILKDMRPNIESVRVRRDLGELTFFEVVTAAAFCYFYQQEVDAVVLETGLGGRLDATNVVPSVISGLTPIGLEHTQQLGDTLSKIAREKVAILKDPGQKFFVAPQLPEAMKIILEHCGALGVVPVRIGVEVRYAVQRQNEDGLVCSVVTPRAQYLSLRSSLLGEHQAMNIAMAVAMVEEFLAPAVIDQEKLKEGVLRTVWPGRFEVIQKDPLVVVDGAHNPAAAEALVKSLKSIFPNKKVVLIFGASSDKDVASVANILEPVAERVIVTCSRHVRAASADKLQSFFSKEKTTVAHTVAEAMEEALSSAQVDEVIVAAGSLFVAAEVRKYL